jgi:hypothetical protein
MADVKISGLPASTLPLAGTEVLPLVQSGVTKKVASDDLTVKNVRSNATSGILQIAGPEASSTRVMTTPNANFTVARTDATQTFTTDQNFSRGINVGSTDVAGFLTLKYATVANWEFNAGLGGSNNIRLYDSIAGNEKWRINGSNGDMTVSTGNLVIGTSGKGIDTSSAIPVTFNINNVEAARIHASRGVSIGNTTDPGATNLSVTGSISSGSRAITKASMPVGSVIQTVYNSYNGNEIITSATYVATSGYFLSITPSSSNSKINIFVTLPFINGLGTGTITIYRNNTTNIDPFSGGLAGSITSGWGGTVSFMIQDSPATTSATAYTIYLKTSAGTVQIRPDVGFGCGTMMLQEIAV